MAVNPRPETIAKIEKVKGYIEQGYTQTEACKKAKLPTSQFYKNKNAVKSKRKYNRRKPKAEYTPLVVQSSQPAMLVVGSPEQIAEVMRQYHA